MMGDWEGEGCTVIGDWGGEGIQERKGEGRGVERGICTYISIFTLFLY